MHKLQHSLTAVLVAALLVPAIVTAGLSGGPRTTTTSVRAHGTDTFEPMLFRGGEKARVVIDGDRDTDLDLYVYDMGGNLVASDDDDTDYCIAEWWPNGTRYYKVVVKNRGSVYNVYTLRTN